MVFEQKYPLWKRNTCCSHELLNKNLSARHGLSPYMLLVQEGSKAIQTVLIFAISLISKLLLDVKTILLKTHTFPLWTQRNQPWTKENSPSWLPSICWKVPWRLLNDTKHEHYQELNHEYNTDLTGKKCPRYKTGKTAYGGYYCSLDWTESLFHKRELLFGTECRLKTFGQGNERP